MFTYVSRVIIAAWLPLDPFGISPRVELRLKEGFRSGARIGV